MKITSRLARSFTVFSYPSAMDLSSTTLRYLATRLRRHRVVIESRWRKLLPERQALLVLAYLRNGDTYTRLAAGFGVGVATVYRYVSEVIEVLAAHGPNLADAIRMAKGEAFVILDGTLIANDRVHHQRPYYSGKHKRHGVNVQVLADPVGRLIWASPALPVRHMISRPRHHGLVAALTLSAIAAFADKRYVGAGGAIGVPYRGRGLIGYRKSFNRHYASIRSRRTRRRHPQGLARTDQDPLQSTPHQPPPEPVAEFDRGQTPSEGRSGGGRQLSAVGVSLSLSAPAGAGVFRWCG